MKALFLCAGRGTRMRPISYSLPKHLIPVGNKPVLQRNVEMVVEAGIKDIGMVVSPSTEDHYRRFLGGEKWGANFEYIQQKNPKGLAHAVNCGRNFVGEEPFVVYLGDNLLQWELDEMLKNYRNSKAVASVLLQSVENPERFGVAEIEKGRVEGLVEKPENPPSDMAIVGVYLFDSGVFDAIEKIEPSDRGELEITDAIGELIDRGEEVSFSSFEGWWVDVGRPEDALEANRLVIEDMEDHLGCSEDRLKIENKENVKISGQADTRDCEVIGPAVIGSRSSISNCRIGPNVSVGKDCELRDVEVSNSIIMDGVELSGGKLQDSLLGNETRLELPDSSFRIYLGDRGRIDRKI